MTTKEQLVIFWFRRDLRLEDNAGLSAALAHGLPVLPLFIFDTEILDKLPKDDARVHFIYQTLKRMRKELQENYGSSIALYHGSPMTIFEKIIQNYTVEAVYTNHDYEPYAQKRDTSIATFLQTRNIAFNTFKDQVIFEKDEVCKDNGTPYVVYTPFMRKWKTIFNANHCKSYTVPFSRENLIQDLQLPDIQLSELGFVPSSIQIPPYHVTAGFIENYEKTRDYPALKQGTSRLGIHLRFGTVSIRAMVQRAIKTKNEIFWNELIWREFFMQILWHFPHTINKAFRSKYDRIAWRNHPQEFEAWKNGQTGYPLVDAGMRELNTTGHMHNRVRMLVASFLCKHLLIDWRWGEAYFAEKLLDYELSSNVGNWQWAAGSGVDAAPYFRIFNPLTQIDKFDKEKTYVNTWVPELQELHYPSPIVNHKMARERCLKVYKTAVG
ncbi:cryptochrome/photolyase family protein [Spongiimicrobium salis]|uniref:cryptochrome/photolyase family protein n=1 Tax=Spongiimicrobium salis TaxID=1667022 RepID=UPI00374DF97C